MHYAGRVFDGIEMQNAVGAALDFWLTAGPETEINIDETIYETVRNGGEIELIFQKDFKDRLKVVLAIEINLCLFTPLACPIGMAA